ncbi:MAG: heavy metal-associated domain-containing protein [Patescibacteria group bacterium]
MNEKITLKITGMDCASCAKVIKYGLEEAKGVSSVDVYFNSAKAYLEFNPEETDSSKIKDEIKSLGYLAVILRN